MMKTDVLRSATLRAPNSTFRIVSGVVENSSQASAKIKVPDTLDLHQQVFQPDLNTIQALRNGFTLIVHVLANVANGNRSIVI